MILANGPLLDTILHQVSVPIYYLSAKTAFQVQTQDFAPTRRNARMNDQRILEELLALLEAKNVKIRREPLGGRGGGLASMKSDRIFFVDTEAATADVATLCAQAVLEVVDIETIYLRPEVRLYLEGHADPSF
jgi:hypothetical protein